MSSIRKIKKLANQFRCAIDMACETKDFYMDIRFRNFPRGCCDDTANLLAQFFLDCDICTYSVCGTYRNGSPEDIQSHVWLLTDSDTIIDITGDQFKYNTELMNYDKAVYVGAMDSFHDAFEVDDIRRNTGICNLGQNYQPRLYGLYEKIISYI